MLLIFIPWILFWPLALQMQRLKYGPLNQRGCDALNSRLQIFYLFTFSKDHWETFTLENKNTKKSTSPLILGMVRCSLSVSDSSSAFNQNRKRGDFENIFA
eukprot:Sdes_comp18603_c0_seq1m8749